MLTGATGFIGSHIAERLVQQRTVTHLFVRRRNSLIDFLEKNGATIYVAQPNNLDILKESLKGTQVVIHCAGATKAVKESDYIEANVEFTNNILSLINEQQKFVFLSSQAAAGPSDSFTPTDEEIEPNPVSHYGKSKLVAENRIKEWGKKNNNNYVILRPCIVYGPRERDIYHGFKLISKGIFFFVGDKKKRFSMVYVDDLVNAVMSCAVHSPKGETYFVSNDEDCSWEELGSSIQKALNKIHLKGLTIPVSLAYVVACLFDILSVATKKPSVINRQKIIETKQSAWVCSNKKIKQKIPWKPAFSLDHGIEKTAEWYMAQHWI